MFEGVSTPVVKTGFEYEYGLLRNACGLRELSDLAVIELRGDDRKGWLQGQVTNDMRPTNHGGSISFCLCAVTGQIVAPCTLWALADKFVILVPKDCAGAFLERVEKMVIMEDVVASDVTADYRLLSIQGPTATKDLTEFVTLPTLDAGIGEIEGEQVAVFRSNRTGFGGWDVLVPIDAEKAAKILEKRFGNVGEEAWEVARIEAGIPVFGKDITAKNLPPEMGQRFENQHVSYSKGCYMGQEVLMRLHSRGHTNKTWMGIVSDRPIPVGASISHGARKDAGVVTSSAESPLYGFIGAAMVRNEAAFENELVSVVGPDETFEAEMRQMPFLRVF